MPACRFVVTSIGITRNVRARQMRRVEMHAVDSDAFKSDDPPVEGQTEAEPEGTIVCHWGVEYASKFSVGEVVDVTFRDRE